MSQPTFPRRSYPTPVELYIIPGIWGFVFFYVGWRAMNYLYVWLSA